MSDTELNEIMEVISGHYEMAESLECVINLACEARERQIKQKSIMQKIKWLIN